jgi:hypothetical protein
VPGLRKERTKMVVKKIPFKVAMLTIEDNWEEATLRLAAEKALQFAPKGTVAVVMAHDHVPIGAYKK